MMDFDELEEQETSAMTFYAISDVHMEVKSNMDWLKNLPGDRNGTIIVAGDVAVTINDLVDALRLFRVKYKHVFFCPGNHEMWCMEKNEPGVGRACNDSFEKLDLVRRACKEVGVYTSAKLIEGVWVVPIFGWYHISWDTEPPLKAPAGRKLIREAEPPERIATDFFLCKWGDLQNGSEELAQLLDAQNDRTEGEEEWGAWPLPAELLEEVAKPPGERDNMIISFSHFLPRLELMPEKRLLFQPNLSKVSGSSWTRARVDSLKPDIHIFGHTHFPWDMELEGVRYRSWPLGKPDEQAIRIAHWPTETAETWPPLPVLDSLGRLNDPPVEWTHLSELCWMSNQYRHRKRDPDSGVMAGYTAAIYCPDAPQFDPDMLAMNNRKKPKECNPFEQERRERYEASGTAYVSGNVKSWSS